ncbi:hepatic lectin-like [Heptranchias perlo]|uniref:hepatic lectin-like n=1 Tax=Heptranchias perlo TaxID=212740 RepID=UPI00355A97AA
MAGEPAYDDFEDFNLNSQQNQRRVNRIPDSRFKVLCCGKGLMVLIFILLSILLIILIAGVIKSSETKETVEELQSHVQMQVSQALNNVSDKSELKEVELRILNEVSQKAKEVLAELSRVHAKLITMISAKLEMLPTPECQDLQCPRNWLHFNQSCYYFSTKRATWNSSKLYCSIRGTQLLVINSVTEQHFVSLETESRRFWIGLIDHGNDGKWQWVDGTDYETTPTFWMPGEPNSQEEGCAHLWVDGMWNDAPCSTKDYWICEKESQQ